MKEVAILGAGYAGLRALRELQKQSELHVTLVDHNDYHYEATDLHEVASGNQPKEKKLSILSRMLWIQKLRHLFKMRLKKWIQTNK